jgi:hypothetical protein
MATELLETPAAMITDVFGNPLAAASNQPDVVDVIQFLDQAMNRISALRTKAVDVARRESELSSGVVDSPASRRIDRRAFVSEIAAALTISERAAENLIGARRALVETLPGTMRALERGEISYRHAQIMVDQAAGLSSEDCTELERAALSRATTSTPTRFERAVRVARERLSPESIEERHVAAIEERTVVVEEDHYGMAWLNARLAAPHTLAIHDRLTKAALRLRAQGDTRTLAQLRADVFAAMLLADDGDAGLTSGRAPQLEDTEAFVRWFHASRPRSS